MAYKHPQTVISPKSRWNLGRVLFNSGQDGWSVVEGTWDDGAVLAIRWNGDDDSGSSGNPQSHGNPTWFVLPPELEGAVRDVANKLSAATSLVKCAISQPPDYEYGVFEVRLTIENPEMRERATIHDVNFAIPQLSNRFFRHKPEFFVPPADKGEPWRGKFKEGTWECTVQTNGIPEDKNPTSMDVVRDVLIASAVQSLEPFIPLKPNAATIEAMTAARRGDVVTVGSVDDLLADLNADD